MSADDLKPNQEPSPNPGSPSPASNEPQQVDPGKPGDQPVSGLLIADEKGVILWVNPAFTHLTGIPKEEITGQTPHTRITYQWDSHFFRQVWELYRSGQAWTGEAVYHKPEETLTLEVTVSPLPGGADGGKKTIIVLTDITRQSAARAAVQESEKRFRQAVEQSPLLIATLLGENFTFINRIGAQLLGFSAPQEVIGRPWTEFVDPQTMAELQKMGGSFLNQPQTRPSPWEIPARRPDGSQFILEVSFAVSSAEGQPVIQIIGQDITERKRVQEALRRQASLAEVDVTFNEPGEPSKVLDKVVEVAKQVLKVGIGACVILPDPNANTFTIRSSNISGLMPQLSYRISPELKAILDKIIAHKQPQLITNVDLSSLGTGSFGKQLRFSAGMGLPLWVNEALVGLLIVLEDQPRTFTPEDIQFITALANRSALAIAKLNLVDSLEQAKNSAEQAAKERADYLANMSHELRAPLVAISYLAALINQSPLQAAQAEKLTAIKTSTERALGLIDDILDFSKLESAKLSLKIREFDLLQTVETSLELVSILAARKNLDLAFNVDKNTPVMLLGDPTRLGQVLTNLLTNAIKFTDAGHILVSVQRHRKQIGTGPLALSEAELLFSVSDTGIGIPEAAQQRLFQPFSQVEHQTRQAETGTGLGLAISRQLIQLMRGEIWVESKGIPGEGSKFSFTIRVGVIPSQPTPCLRANAPGLAGKTVTFVGQPCLSWSLLAEWLAYWGATVRQFESAPTAISWLNQKPALHAVIVDADSLQPEDEQPLSEAFWLLGQNRHLPVLLYTQPDRTLPDQLRQSAAAVLNRPFNPMQLHRRLSDAMQYGAAITQPRVFDPDMQLLLVDDDPISQAAINLSLERLGYQADTARNGYEALQALTRKRYNLVIMDFRMDQMDGLAATRQMREKITADQQPVIAILTAGVTPNEWNMLQKAGIDAYLQKPIPMDRLVQLIELARRHALPAAIAQQGKAGLQASPTPTGPLGEQTVDADVLQDLVGLFGPANSEHPSEIFQLFYQNAPLLLEKAKTCAARQQLDALKDHLHALRGTVEIFGAAALAKLCRSLEKEITQGQVNQLDEQMQAIDAEFQRVVKALQAYQESS